VLQFPAHLNALPKNRPDLQLLLLENTLYYYPRCRLVRRWPCQIHRTTVHLLNIRAQGEKYCRSCRPSMKTRTIECPGWVWVSILNIHPSSYITFDSGSLPSPFTRDGDDIPSSPSVDGLPIANQSDCDWATFIIAYASGRWDPLRTPNPPRSLFTSSPPGYLPISVPPNAVTLDSSNSGGQADSLRGVPGDSPQTHQDTRVLTTEDVPKLQSTSSGTSSLSVPTPTHSVIRFRAPAPAKIPLPAYRMRNSYSTSAAPYLSSNLVGSIPAHSNTELQTVVAAMRWAAVSVDISPLALPSPEHELTDPMRGVTATVPGSYPQENNQPDHPPTPGTMRKSRSFWHGTTDVENASSTPKVSSLHPATIEASPEMDTKDEMTLDRQLENAPASSISVLNSHTSHPQVATPPTTSSWTLTTQFSSGPPDPLDYFGSHLGQQEGNVGTMSAPALPRQVPLTRQTSSPLPVLVPRDPIILGGRVVPDPIKAGRATKEEQLFAELGYLPPPNPPDELERRRALYKCDSSSHYDLLWRLTVSTTGLISGIRDPTSILIG
jgi:hypothetical protein